jgi:rhodanese-related sulfurtransferase
MYRKIFIPILIFALVLGFACKSPKVEEANLSDGFEMLIDYLESEADYVNQSETPFFINVPDLYANLDSNYLVIDIRPEEEYERAHIVGSVNILPKDIVEYFENTIHAPGFEKIAIVCNAGYQAPFVAMGMRYLGYLNVYPVRNGLSSWSYDIAKDYRLANISDSHLGKLDTIGYEMPEPGEFPKLMTAHEDAYAILRERIIEILNDDFSQYFISFEELMDNQDEYFIVSYWPEARYKSGHLTGSVRYQPRDFLKKDRFLNTLPTDKTIVIQCYMGSHANFVIMYLRILGYEAKSLLYGANNFIHSVMMAEERPGRWFSLEKDVFDLPLTGIEHTVKEENIIVEPETKIQGGC